MVPSLLASAEGLHFVYLFLYSTQWVPWPSIGYHCMGAGVDRISLSHPTSGGKPLLAYGDSVLQVSAPKHSNQDNIDPWDIVCEQVDGS